MSDNGMNDHGNHPDADLATLIGLAGQRTPVQAERAARVRGVVEREWKDAVDERRGRRWFRLGAAAAAIVVALVAIVFSMRTALFVDPVPAGSVALVRGTLTVDGVEGSVSGGATFTTARRIATDHGSLASVRTIGGASVRMDRSTTIVFETPDRIRVLTGALYVDSPADAAAPPLEILAGDTTVREIGTQFETRLTTESTIVRVREGRVIVHADEEVEADAGTELAVAADGAVTRRTVDPWGPEWGWTLEAAPAFSIEGRTLAEFLDWASRETGLQADTSAIDSAILGSRLHGSIEGLTPLEAIDVVLATTGLEGSEAEGRLVVRRSAE